VAARWQLNLRASSKLDNNSATTAELEREMARK
jgi:hypothetical protein